VKILTAKLLDGKATAAKVRQKIGGEVADLKAGGKGIPGLAVVIVGENPASKVYVRQKEKACNAVGFNSVLHRLPENTSQEELLTLVEGMNNDPEINGILVQLPLPPQINEDSIIKAIKPEKDVDGFHPVNMGKLVTGLPSTQPCTPKGIMYLLDEYGIEIEGKTAVVLGRSNIVGKPIAHMLMSKNATVTVCHSRTKDIAEYTRRADIIVAAIGKPRFLTADMVKDGAVIVDVGINRLEEGLVGDTDFGALKEKVSFITPVPGGIGPMTIAMLLLNTLEAFKKGL